MGWVDGRPTLTPLPSCPARATTDGIPLHLQQQCHQTQHQWAFAAKLSEAEQFQLERTATRIAATTAAPVSTGGNGGNSSSAHGQRGVSKADAQCEREERGEQERAARRAAERAGREKVWSGVLF